MKKLITSTIIVLPIILLVIMLVSGAIMSITSYIYVEKLEISETKALVMEMPDEQNPPTHNLMNEVVVLPLQATNRDLDFSSDNEDVVKISDKGIITAVGYGTTFVHATSKENKAATGSREIIVTDRSAHLIKFDGEVKNEMYEGETQQLKAVVLPENAEDTTFYWESSNEDILQADSTSGIVTAKSFGSATISAISNDNNDVKATVDIISYPKIRGLELDKTPIVTSAKDIKFVDVTIYPNDSGMSLSYISDNEDIAIVDDKGNIAFKDAGAVSITVIATDFGGKKIEEKKEYTSTYGYYLGPLFDQKAYTVNFDQYANGEKLPIDVMSAPAGAYQLINSVTFDVDGVLQFDDISKTFKFVGEMPQGRAFVDVKVSATVFDIQSNQMNERYEDGFRLYVKRNATEAKVSYLGEEVSEIITTQKTFTFSTDLKQDVNIINIAGSPANHTNEWKYELISGEGIATLDSDSLTFKGEGTAKVRLELISEGTTYAQTDIAITVVSLKGKEKPVEIKEQQTQIVFKYDGETEESGLIFLNTPMGAQLQYDLVSGRDVVSLEQVNDVYKISPLKGGFATVQIKAVGAQGVMKRWDVHIYVDKPVDEKNLEVKINGTYETSLRTSFESFAYSASVSNEYGEMDGKEFYVVIDGQEIIVDELTKNDTVYFGDKDAVTITFAVRYADSLSAYPIAQKTLVSATRTISTSHGRLDVPPEVVFNQNPLSEGEDNAILIGNVGESVKLKVVTENFSPADFVLESNMEIKSTQNVEAEVSDGGKTVMLTGLGRCKAEKLNLIIGGIIFRLTVDVNLNAKEISVSYMGRQTDQINTTKSDLTLTPQSDTSPTLINVILDPIDTTDAIEYQFAQESEIAKINGNKLSFEDSGSVRIKIVAKSSTNKITAEKEIEVIYSKDVLGEVNIDLNGQNEAYVVLDMTDSSNCEKGRILYTQPENAQVQYEIAKGDDIIQLSQDKGQYLITPQKGGFAEVKITASYTDGHSDEWQIYVYVDYEVKESAFTILVNGQSPESFRTSNESVDYSVAVDNESGAMAGKQLYVNINGKQTNINDFANYNGKAEFGEGEQLVITFGVVYSDTLNAKYGISDDSALIVVSKTLLTTHGKIDNAPTVRQQGGQPLNYGSKNNIVFDNLNKQIVLKVEEENFAPSDFTLQKYKPILEANDYVNVSISDDGATITLTSRAVCSGAYMYLTIGGKTFTLIVDVYRNAETMSISYKGAKVSSIQTLQNVLTFTTSEDDIDISHINVLVGPQGHTNAISYQLIEGQDCAKLIDNALEFSAVGTAKVQISVVAYGGGHILDAEITITYTQQSENREVVDFSDNSDKQKNIVLGVDGKNEGAILFNTPSDTYITYEVVGNQNIIQLDSQANGIHSIKALKGGFATIKITATKKAQPGAVRLMAASDQQVWTIQVYVDYAVESSDVSVTFNGQNVNNFRTSRRSVQYAVSVEDRNGSTQGKELYVVYNGQEIRADKFVNYTNELRFDNTDKCNMRFEIRYQTEVAQQFGKNNQRVVSVSRYVSTSMETLDELPTITYNDQSLVQGVNKIDFSNIGEKVVLTIAGAFTPSDFDLATHKPELVGTNYVKVDISADGRTIELTSQNRCSDQTMILSVGGKSFILSVNIISKADAVEVTYDGALLTNLQQYKTLLSSLSFDVVAKRADGKDIDNKTVEYSVNNNDWQTANIVNGVVTISISGATTIYFRSADLGASTQIHITKCQLFDFGVTLKYSGGTIATIDSVKAQTSADYDLPSNIGYLTLEIAVDDEYLGGFGTNETFSDMFETYLGPSEWKVSYSASTSQINISFNNEKDFNRLIKITYNGIELNLNLACVHIEKIQFEGFDINKASDVYLGYQQVRVFAKHSYYNGQKVDYFKMPFSALSSISDQTTVLSANITWKLSRYVGNSLIQELTVQRGKKVVYNGKQYTIAQGSNGYVLKDQSGNDASGVTWVDIYSEPGYARIYFGNFAGLSESDIQNDYFGAFDDKDWTRPSQPVDDKSGRTFTPSQNAFSFLRVEAGDGAVNGVNTHFNFNVLDDNSLVNIFDADGYYANQNIVLHHDLYGPGERKDVEDKFVLSDLGSNLDETNDITYIGRTLIYGNGYQVNYEKFNEYLVAKNTNVGTITIGNTYNAVILGANPDSTRAIDQDHLKVRLNKNQSGPTYQYYCLVKDFRQSFRLNGANKVGYIKNCVFRNASKEALCINNERAKLYVENVVMDNVKVAMLTGQNNTYYVKGSLDILNYIGKTEAIKTFAGDDIPDNVINLFAKAFEKKIDTIEQYMEFFGADGGKNELDGSKYVNLCVVNKGDKTFKDANTLYHYFWDDDKKEYVQEQADATGTSNGALRTIITSAKQSLAIYDVPGFSGMTYDSPNTVDGGYVEAKKGTLSTTYYLKRDMSQLFTDKRYIRLLCQYKTIDNGKLVKNDEHIMWHIQQAYRDTSLIVGRTLDHIADLKESLKGVTWSDGTRANDYM